MKKLLIFLVIISAGIGIAYYEQAYACRQPIAYDMGSFDERFGITKNKFMTTIKEAESIWEKETGQDLFNYKPGGKLKINLVFDQREATTIAANQSKQQIEGSRESYDALLNQYKTQEASYKSDLAAYNSEVSQFKIELDTYNAKVAAANQKGGATPKEYSDLEKERKDLEYQRTRIDNDEIALNQEASSLNTLGDQVNELAHKLNIEVDVHNQRFGVAKEFEQGQYSGKIDVYQFDTISDLRLVIAHELGHAMGLDHVENPKSLMYYLMEKQDPKNPTLSQEDLAAFADRCGFNIPNFHIPKLQELFSH